MKKSLLGGAIIFCLVIGTLTGHCQPSTAVSESLKADSEAKKAAAAAAKSKADADAKAAEAAEAAAKAKREALLPKEAAVKSHITEHGPSIGYVFFLESGARFQSPYTISYDATANTAKLTKAGNSTAGFLQFSYFDRFVLRDPGTYSGAEGDMLDKRRDKGKSWDKRKVGRSLTNTSDRAEDKFAHSQFDWLVPFAHYPDIEWHLGYTFANGSSSSTFSSSSIAGGGDFYSDASIGLPIMRMSDLSH
ncbi:MAG TPA: hypothetical protein VGC95_08715, partial [Chitinophagaceae bacterium]